MKFWKLDINRILSIIFGTLLLATATNAILLPNQLLSGGVSGIAMFLHFLLGWNISMVIILINVPLFMIAFFFLNRKFLYYSLFGMMMLSFWIEVTSGLVFPLYDSLSIVFMAGLINGLGYGIIFHADGSTAGVDIISKIINKYFSFSMGTVSLAVNGCIILLSLFQFGLDLAVLTLAVMFTASRVTNYVVEGTQFRRTVSIITKEAYHKAIADDIIKEIHRGVTIVPALGAYSNETKYILYTTISLRELAKVREIVRSHDPNCFMTVSETARVIGRGRGFGNHTPG